MGFMIGILALWLFSTAVGFAAGVIFRTPVRPVGTLRIDCSEPDEAPRVFLELYRDTGDISAMKTVTLNVSTISYIPRG